jgi:hypothetical protein
MPIKLKEEKEKNLISEKDFQKLKIREIKLKPFVTTREEQTQTNKKMIEVLKILGITTGFSAISAATIKLIKLPSELMFFLPPLFLVFILFGKPNSIKEKLKSNNKVDKNQEFVKKDLNEKLKEAIDAAIIEEFKSKKESAPAPLSNLLSEIEKIIWAKPVMQLIDKIESGNINIKIGKEKPTIIYLFKSEPFLLVAVGFDYKILLRATYLLGCNAIKEVNYVSRIDKNIIDEIKENIKNGDVEVKIGEEERLIFEK